MKRKTIKKLGIIIMSAMIAASPVVTPFTTMTVYAEEERVFTTDNGTIKSDESYDKNTASNVGNKGTINNNSGEVNINEGTIINNSGKVDENWKSGKVENNLGGATIDYNDGKVKNNLDGATINENYDTVSCNKSGGIIKDNYFVVSTNEGKIEVNNNYAQVVNNNLGGQIDINNNIVTNNSGIITENYGSVGNNTGTIKNNYTSINGYGGVVDNNNGEIKNQWYEVKLVNNTTELKIKCEDAGSIKDRNNSGNTDVFAKEAAAITIYSTNPNRIIDALEGEIEYVKNADGSITISNIQNPYSILTTLIDKILPPTSSSEPEKKEDDNKKKEEVVIDVVAENPILAAPVIAQALAQPQIVVPAGNVNAVTVVAENPVAATQAAKTLQNDPVVVAQAQELTVHMEAVTAAYKEVAVKELAAAPNQAVVGSAEYEVKQAAIVADLANQMASLNNLTVQSLAVVQKIGVSVATGGCTKLEAANVSLLNEILSKGVPVTLTYAIDGAPVTIKIPAGVNLTRFIGADGRLDLTKLKAYIVR